MWQEVLPAASRASFTLSQLWRVWLSTALAAVAFAAPVAASSTEVGVEPTALASALWFAGSEDKAGWRNACFGFDGHGRFAQVYGGL